MHNHTTAYLESLRSYDLTLAAPDSLVLPVAAAIVARTIFAGADAVEWTKPGLRAVCPVAIQVLKRAHGSTPLDDADRDRVRALALRGWEVVERQHTAQLAATTIYGSSGRRLAGGASDVPVWADLVQAHLCPVQVLLVAAALAVVRQPGHPFALLSAQNADLREAAERNLRAAGVLSWEGALSYGAETWMPELATVCARDVLEYPSPLPPGESWFMGRQAA